MSDTKVMVLRALNCLRLEAPASVVDDVSKIVLGHIAKLEAALMDCALATHCNGDIDVVRTEVDAINVATLGPLPHVRPALPNCPAAGGENGGTQ